MTARTRPEIAIRLYFGAVIRSGAEGRNARNIEDAECRGPKAYIHDHESSSGRGTTSRSAKEERKEDLETEISPLRLSRDNQPLPKNLPRVLQPRGHQVAVC